MRITVYLATNTTNGHEYIGVTRRALAVRRREHGSSARTGIRACPFHKAIAKHGWEAFRFETLLTCDTEDEAKQHEIRLIAERRPRYNCTAGGDGNTGRFWSEASRELIAASKRGNTYRRGQTHTEAVRAVLRKYGLRDREKAIANLAAGRMKLMRPVVCLDDGRRYESASAAARNYAVPKSAVIELCLGKRGRKTIGGRRFAYVGAP